MINSILVIAIIAIIVYIRALFGVSDKIVDSIDYLVDVLVSLYVGLSYILLTGDNG